MPHHRRSKAALEVPGRLGALNIERFGLKWLLLNAIRVEKKSRARFFNKRNHLTDRAEAQTSGRHKERRQSY
jgi:hypothetical protein